MAPACSRKNCPRCSSDSAVKKDLSSAARCAATASDSLAPSTTSPLIANGSVTRPHSHVSAAAATTQQLDPKAIVTMVFPGKVQSLGQLP